MRDQYIYAVRNVVTGKLQSSKSKGKKFYEYKSYAELRAREYNEHGGPDYRRDRYEVVKFKLVEVE